MLFYKDFAVPFERKFHFNTLTYQDKCPILGRISSEPQKTLLPLVMEEETGKVEPKAQEKQTTPPKRFTYGSLLDAMNGIHVYVENPDIRKKLREVDGIGSAATQESIVNLLFKRGFLEKKKKAVFSTPLGQSLIDLLDSGRGNLLTQPDLTALWEQDMTRIQNGEYSLDGFMMEVEKMVREILEKPLDTSKIQGQTRSPKCLNEDCEGFLMHRKGKFGTFFSCPVCQGTFRDEKGKPLKKKEEAQTKEAPCPLACGGKAIQRKGSYGLFWTCSCTQETFKDIDGVPMVKEKKAALPQSPCPVKGCKGTATRLKAKEGDRFFWKCAKCANFFDDKDGKPVIRGKKSK